MKIEILEWVEVSLHPSKYLQLSSLEAYQVYREWSKKYAELAEPASYGFFLEVVTEYYRAYPVWEDKIQAAVLYFYGELNS